MTRLRLDRRKAATLVALALEQRPHVRDELAKRDPDGQRWRIRAVLGADNRVLLAAVVPDAPDPQAIALWLGPPHFVERDDA